MFDLALEDTFGKRYVIKAFQQNTHQGSLQPLTFTDKNRAYSFVCGLRVPHGYWRRTLHSITQSNLSAIHCKSTSGQHSPEHLISEYLYRGRLYIYELVNYNADKNNQSKRSFDQGNGERYSFHHVSAQLLDSTQQRVALNSEAAVSELLKDLSCDEQQLDELARSLNLGDTQGSNGQSQALIITAIMAGDVIVRFQPKRVTPPEPMELPGLSAVDRPAQAPVANSPVATPAESISTAAAAASLPEPRSQAKTLENAAEEGDSFCETCEKAKAARAL